MNNLAIKREEWQTTVSYSGWYAWKYADLLCHECIGIEWFEVEKTGTESFVIYYLGGNAYKQSSSRPLDNLLVCPVTITITHPYGNNT